MNNQYQGLLGNNLMSQLNLQAPQMAPQQLSLNMLIELLRNGNGQDLAFLDQLRPKTPQEGTTTTGIRG